MTRGPFVAVDDVVNALNTVRAADAVSVVRCEDCRYCLYRIGESLYTGETLEELICVVDSGLDADEWESGFYFDVEPKHFCAAGKRKDDEEWEH